MNRQVRDPYAWWCERAAMGQIGSSFPTRLGTVFIFFAMFKPCKLKYFLQPLYIVKIIKIKYYAKRKTDCW